MNINTEDDIIRVVREDDWMMDVLHAAKALQLPDWWVCAGFVRSKLWDMLHGYRGRTPLSDVDVIYYDAIVKPTPFFGATDERLHYYKTRLAKKNWESRWPKIQLTFPHGPIPEAQR